MISNKPSVTKLMEGFLILNTMKSQIEGDIIDLFERTEKNAWLIHQANCFHTMRAGLAGQLSVKYPGIVDVDIVGSKKANPYKLGYFTIYVHDHLKRKYIVNLYGQYRPGPNTEYSALIKGLSRLAKLKFQKEDNILLPKIGSGIGNAEWNVVEHIIDKELKSFNYTIVYYKPPVKYS